MGRSCCLSSAALSPRQGCRAAGLGPGEVTRHFPAESAAVTLFPALLLHNAVPPPTPSPPPPLPTPSPTPPRGAQLRLSHNQRAPGPGGHRPPDPRPSVPAPAPRCPLPPPGIRSREQPSTARSYPVLGGEGRAPHFLFPQEEPGPPLPAGTPRRFGGGTPAAEPAP